MDSRSRVRSPHETTVFFLKCLLMSFWIGATMLAILVAPPILNGGIPQNGLLWMAIFSLFGCGNVYALVTCLAKQPQASNASNRPPTPKPMPQPPVKGVMPRGLIATGVVGLVLLVAAPLVYSKFAKEEDAGLKRLGPATAAVAKKCSEIASLEQKLFQSDEKTVMAECLLQYDQKYLELRATAALKK